jgi:hypothetical protein
MPRQVSWWPDPKDLRVHLRSLREIIGHFTEALGLARYALYKQDYGGPVGFRMALVRRAGTQSSAIVSCCSSPSPRCFATRTALRMFRADGRW